MSGDPKKLKAFRLADELVVKAYRVTARFLPEEPYGEPAQIRRAAVSAPTSRVEGCVRRALEDSLDSVSVAFGSASEVRSLLGLARRLRVLAATDRNPLEDRYGELARGL